MDLLSIGYGALGGLGWSLLRIAYHKADPEEEIEVQYRRIAKTAIIGIAVGAFAGYSGQQISTNVFEALETAALSSMMATGLLDTVVNLVIRLWKRFTG